MTRKGLDFADIYRNAMAYADLFYFIDDINAATTLYQRQVELQYDLFVALSYTPPADREIYIKTCVETFVEVWHKLTPDDTPTIQAETLNFNNG